MESGDIFNDFTGQDPIKMKIFGIQPKDSENILPYGSHIYLLDDTGPNYKIAQTPNNVYTMPKIIQKIRDDFLMRLRPPYIRASLVSPPKVVNGAIQINPPNIPNQVVNGAIQINPVVNPPIPQVVNGAIVIKRIRRTMDAALIILPIPPQVNGTIQIQPLAVVNPVVNGAIQIQPLAVVNPVVNGAIQIQPLDVVNPVVNGAIQIQPLDVVNPVVNGAIQINPVVIKFGPIVQMIRDDTIDEINSKLNQYIQDPTWNWKKTYTKRKKLKDGSYKSKYNNNKSVFIQ